MRNFRSNLPGEYPGHAYPNIGLKINGTDITEATGGRATVIAVTGREIITPRLESYARAGRYGRRVEDWQLDARTLIVEILTNEYEEATRLLNPLLFGQLDLEFLDQPGWYHRAYFESNNRPRNDRTRQVVSLHFHAADPYARRPAAATTGTISTAEPYPVLLQEIKAIAVTALDSLIITSTAGYGLVVAGPIAENSEVVIRWDRRPVVTINGLDRTKRLYLTSDYQELKEELRDGDKLTANNATLAIRYEERRA